MPLPIIRTATRGSKYMIGCIGSGGAARSLILTKVSSATRRLVSPASRISLMALYWLRPFAPKILLCTSVSCAKKMSSKGCAGITLYVVVLREGWTKTLSPPPLRLKLARMVGRSRVAVADGHCHLGFPSLHSGVSMTSCAPKSMVFMVTLFWLGLLSSFVTNSSWTKSPSILTNSFISSSVYRVNPSADTDSRSALPDTSVLGERIPKRRRKRSFTAATSSSLSPRSPDCRRWPE
mmetsp:Transcript_23099/g.54523  ORF Transcript_23099/g.54523 Transcript_23099/m.54523 type:complete len:236 (-) Transcript_23099:350-1057(-)